MDFQEDVRHVSTHPLVLIVALLSALAIGLVGIYDLGGVSAPTKAPGGTTLKYYSDRPGPDSPSRNRPEAPDPWAGHGQ